MTTMGDSARTFALDGTIQIFWDFSSSFSTYLHDLIQQHSPHLQVIELTDIAGAQDWFLQQIQF